MKRIIKLYLVVSVFFLSPVIADNVEWESVKGAVSYQFQLKDKNGTIVQENLDLKINKIELSINIPGKYTYKIGVVDKEGNVVFGEWENYDIEDNSLGEGKEASFHFEWEAVPKATTYFLEIETPAKKLAKAIKTKNTQKDVVLKVGKYQYRTSHELKGKKIWSEWKEIDVIPPVPKKELPKPLFSERTKITFRSAIIPGWGQKTREDKAWHVYSYAFLLIPLGVISIINSKSNTSAENDYKNFLNMGILAASSPNADSSLGLLIGIQAIQNRENMNASYATGRNYLLGLGGLYLFNIIDAYFFHNYSKPAEVKTTSFDFQISKQRRAANGNMENGFELGWKFSF